MYIINKKCFNNNQLEYNDFKKWGYDIDSDENSYAVLNRYMQRDFPRVFKKMAKLFCFDHPAGKKNGKRNSIIYMNY